VGHLRGWFPSGTEPSPFKAWSVVTLMLVGPVLESFLLAGLATALGRRSANPWMIAAISGTAWGALHALGKSGAAGAFAFLGSTYDYFNGNSRAFSNTGSLLANHSAAEVSTGKSMGRVWWKASPLPIRLEL